MALTASLPCTAPYRLAGRGFGGRPTPARRAHDPEPTVNEHPNFPPHFQDTVRAMIRVTGLNLRPYPGNVSLGWYLVFREHGAAYAVCPTAWLRVPVANRASFTEGPGPVHAMRELGALRTDDAIARWHLGTEHEMLHNADRLPILDLSPVNPRIVRVGMSILGDGARHDDFDALVAHIDDVLSALVRASEGAHMDVQTVTCGLTERRGDDHEPFVKFTIPGGVIDTDLAAENLIRECLHGAFSRTWNRPTVDGYVRAYCHACKRVTVHYPTPANGHDYEIACMNDRGTCRVDGCTNRAHHHGGTDVCRYHSHDVRDPRTCA